MISTDNKNPAPPVPPKPARPLQIEKQSEKKTPPAKPPKPSSSSTNNSPTEKQIAELFETLKMEHGVRFVSPGSPGLPRKGSISKKGSSPQLETLMEKKELEVNASIFSECKKKEVKLK